MRRAAGGLALAALLPASAAVVEASPYLRSAVQLPLTPQRWGGASVLGDFDGDGHTDAVYGFATGLGVMALLGDGAGGFTRPILTLVPSVPGAGGAVSMVAADLNGDGRLDVATSDFATGPAVFLGLGDGRFTATSLGGEIATGGLDVGDFDGDGHLDLAVARRAFSGIPTQVLVYRGDGSGTFATPVVWSVPALLYPRGVVAADLDGDGRDDLAVADEFGDAVGVVLGSAGLALAFRGPFPACDGTLDVDAGDLNGDGRIDLVTACSAGRNAVLLGNGAGAFAAAQLLDGPRQATSVALADLDADGRLDLASSGWNLWLRRGDGNGGFGPARGYGVSLPLAVGHVDADGRLDLLAGGSLLFGDGTGGMAAQAAFPAGPQPRFAAAADFDGDGHQDVAVANQSGAVHLLRGDGQGGFAAPLGQLHGTGPTGMVPADFDRDGDPDLAVAYAGTQDVVVLRNDGHGVFASRSYPVGGNPIAIAAGDFGGDGVDDLLVANETQGSLVVLHGLGDGTFTVGGTTSLGTAYPALAVGHLNPDTRLDVATVRDAKGFVSVLHGTGLETFATATALPVPLRSRPASLVAADLDADGAADLAAAADVQPDASASTLGVLAGAGDGRFVTVEGQSPALLAGPLALDFTGDGRLELAALDTTDSFPDAIHLLERSAGGTYRSPDDGGLPIGGRGGALFAADFDEDGRLDLGATSESADAVTLFLGRSPGGPSADLSVTIEDTPDPAPAGTPLHVRVAAANRGPAAARNVRLRYRLPPATDVLSSSPGAPVCRLDQGIVTCELATLAAGATFALDVDLDAGAHTHGGVLPSWAEVAASSPADPEMGDNFTDARTTVNIVDLAVGVSDTPDPVQPGQRFRYRLEARNHGDMPATSVEVATALPPGVVLVALPPGCFTADDVHVSCVAGTLATGDARSFDVDVRAGAFTSVVLEATVRAFETDLATQDNTEREETTMVLGRAAELTHGSTRRGSLPPGDPAQESFLVLVPPRASFEVVLDEASGDYAAGSNAVALERLAADTSTVLQAGLPVGTGRSRTLRWQNTTDEPQRQLVRVRSRGCTTGCGPDDGYRLRAYETTAALARFNTTGGQATVVVVQNSGGAAVSGTLWFTGIDGSLAAARSFFVPARGVFTLNVATLLPGRSGALTVTHEAGYGGLAAKAIAIEPKNGTAYDTVLQYRAR